VQVGWTPETTGLMGTPTIQHTAEI